MGHAVLVGAVYLVVTWLVLLALVVVARPSRDTLQSLPRLLPDTVRLIRGLARDRTIPRFARIPVWALLVYLAIPIDLVPDFIPLIGYADDAILVGFVLRRLLRRAGPAKVIEHWPGDTDALATLRRVLRLPSS